MISQRTDLSSASQWSLEMEEMESFCWVLRAFTIVNSALSYAVCCWLGRWQGKRARTVFFLILSAVIFRSFSFFSFSSSCHRRRISLSVSRLLFIILSTMEHQHSGTVDDIDRIHDKSMKIQLHPHDKYKKCRIMFANIPQLTQREFFYSSIFPTSLSDFFFAMFASCQLTLVSLIYTQAESMKA